MLWFIALALLALVMTISDKLWDNQLTIFGLVPIGFCFWLLAGVVMKALSLP